jgi:hypothetical protein
MDYEQLDSMSEIWKDVMERHLSMFEDLARPPECADGWAILVENLMEDIEQVVREADEEVSLRVTRIKEKYGGLRFVADVRCSEDSQDRVKELIAEAEANSYGVCELCGEPGDLRSERTWIRTLCEYHARREHSES